MNSPLLYLTSCSEFSIPQATVQGRKEGGELGIHSQEQRGHHFPPQSLLTSFSMVCEGTSCLGRPGDAGAWFPAGSGPMRR